MPWDYTYQGPNQVEIREMKEGENKNCAVEVVSLVSKLDAPVVFLGLHPT
jgi:hypothetical protein